MKKVKKKYERPSGAAASSATTCWRKNWNILRWPRVFRRKKTYDSAADAVFATGFGEYVVEYT